MIHKITIVVNVKKREEVRKSVMVSVNGKNLKFNNMGYFRGKKGWKHPETVTETTELIFVTKGTVFISEAGVKYPVEAGSLVILEKGKVHGGYAFSESDVEFYWVHLFFSGKPIHYRKIHTSPRFAETEYFFRELNHLQCVGEIESVELKLFDFLIEIYTEKRNEDKLCYDVREFVRMHINESISVSLISEKFGYSPSHLSKRFKKTERLSLKQYIDKEKLSLIKNYLVSSNLSLKEISALCNFQSENDFIKFFNYHENITPSEFRNRYARSHNNIV